MIYPQISFTDPTFHNFPAPCESVTGGYATVLVIAGTVEGIVIILNFPRFSHTISQM